MPGNNQTSAMPLVFKLSEVYDPDKKRLLATEDWSLFSAN